MSKKVRFVWIRWLDACLKTEWEVASQQPDGATCEVAGFLVRETEEFIWIGLQKDERDEFKEVLAIPKVLVQKRRFLK